ncbi:hypothetical protein [Streptomyces sp. H39-C1]|uniref:hypothetical protein n=1 Tax=Streptomyces sp. H39-C1 TaxID=3004355 RepID=UPI0022AF39C2|nr:hypothetical protein [Streptomyces sp. H39-C1]MCZ4099838.1 hypothetical protein [Streptomyces sp. H39-C1]
MTFFAGQRVSASQLNPVTFSGYQIATQSVPNNAWTGATFDGEYEDSHGGHSTVTLNGTYTIPVTGFYDLAAGSSFVPNVTGLRGVKILKSGVIINRATCYAATGPSAGATPFVAVKENCVAGDTITVQIYQVSGGALSTLANGEATCHLEISLIRR